MLGSWISRRRRICGHGGAGGARGHEAAGGVRRVRRGSSSGERVDSARSSRWAAGAEAEVARTAGGRRPPAAGAIGAHPAIDHRFAAGPVEVAVLPLDAGGSGEPDRARVRHFGVAEHGGSLPGWVGHEPAEAGAPGL